MSLIRKVTDFLRGEHPPTLRNRVGGMAMVHGFTDSDTSELNGAIVTTVRLNDRSFWVIEPALLMVSRHRRESVAGGVAEPGDRVDVVAISDEHLRPIKNPGAGEKTQERSFQPPVPAKPRENA